MRTGFRRADMELLIGCGNNRKKCLLLDPAQPDWDELVTLDNDPNCGADVEWDLARQIKLPFDDEKFDEIHAYHVLEHTGQQGDYRFFFWQWGEFWRLLKPGGVFCGIVPTGPWIWGDPGHTRSISIESLTYLDQSEYTRQVGNTALADYRRFYRADFSAVHYELMEGHQASFVLTAIKPSRISV